MESQVEKMYRNAGVGYLMYVVDTFPPVEYPQIDFTAEKQLELIKCLARKSHITIGLGLPWGQYDDDWWTITRFGGGGGKDKYQFKEALAELVNNLWQSLTEEERKQIKEILE